MAKKQLPLLTVIVPTYRRPQLLKRALESLKAQKFVGFEVHIYDNASEDKTADIVSLFVSQDPRFKYYKHSTNIGCENNFAFSLKHIKTPYFSFVSDDDLLYPDCFTDLIELMEKQRDIGFAFGETVQIDEKGRCVSRHMESSANKVTYFGVGEAIAPLLRGHFPCWTGGIFRTALLIDIGYLDSETFLIDLDYQMRINTKYSCAVLNKPSSGFLQHMGGSSFLPLSRPFFYGYSVVLHKIQLGQIRAPDLEKHFRAHFIRIFFVKMMVAIERRRFDLVRSYSVEENNIVPIRLCYMHFFICRVFGYIAYGIRPVGFICSRLLRLRRWVKNRRTFKHNKKQNFSICKELNA